MRKSIFATLVCCSLTLGAFAQRFAFVDTQYILDQMPEYTNAQKQIDDLSKQWQAEVDQKYADIDKLYKQYQADQVLLTEEMKQQRQKEIEDQEKAAKDLKTKYFGYQGQLFQKRQELVKPVQDKVYDAIEKIATTKQYDFVFDKSAGSTIMYANSKNNISDQVLQGLGITPKQ